MGSCLLWLMQTDAVGRASTYVSTVYINIYNIVYINIYNIVFKISSANDDILKHIMYSYNLYRAYPLATGKKEKQHTCDFMQNPYHINGGFYGQTP